MGPAADGRRPVLSPGSSLRIGSPQERPDRLVPISGYREAGLVAEFSENGGRSWQGATIYPGPSVDAWRSADPAAWNASVEKGALPAGQAVCLWNQFFDLADPAAGARLRLKRGADGPIVEEKAFPAETLSAALVITAANLPEFLDGGIPAPWTSAPSSRPGTTFRNIACPAEGERTALVIRPDLFGRHKIYIGLDRPSAFLLSLSGEDIAYPIPEYGAAPAGNGKDRLSQDILLKSADLTGQTLRLAVGGTRQPQGVSVRYIRFVPQSPAETAAEQEATALARERGRPFAAYVETVEGGFFHAPESTLRGYLRSEMRLNRARGATDAYVHVLRIGVRSWYHSDIIERDAFGSEEELLAAARRTSRTFGEPLPPDTQSLGWEYSRRWAEWMRQGDPLAVAVEEGRAAGLRVFADLGMNVTHILDAPWLTEKAVVEHPEWLSDHKMYLDYKKKGVQNYAVSIVADILAKYDLDGIHLDFARWGYNRAYDEASLVAVMLRFQAARLAAEKRLGHQVVLSVRIPSYYYCPDADWAAARYGGEHPWFTGALRTWSREGWIDRVMACTMSEKNLPALSHKRYLDAIAGTKVELWGDLYAVSSSLPGYSTSAHILEVARRWVSEGLGGGFFFYTPFRPAELDRINWQLRLVDFPQAAAALVR